MTRKQRHTYTALISSIVGILMIVGVIWGAGTKTQSMDDRIRSNTTDIIKLEQSNSEEHREIKSSLKEMRDENRENFRILLERVK